MEAYIVTGCFILFDILTGLLKGLYKGGIDSTALRKGLYHKLSEVLAVAGSALFEHGTRYVEIGVELPLVSFVTVYICLMEATSILENLCEVNPRLGKVFKRFLAKLNADDENEGG